MIQHVQNPSDVRSQVGDVAALGGRILLAAIFVASGLHKVNAPEETVAYIAKAGMPFTKAGNAAATLVELGAAALLIVGFCTRTASLLLALFCLLTAVIFHAELGDPQQSVQLLKNVAMAGGLLQVLAYGPGRFSIDAIRAGRGGR